MRWLRNSFSVLGVALVCSLAAPSCAENDSMLFVEGVLAIEATNCVAQPEVGAQLRTGGTLDLSLTQGYTVALLVGSQLTQRGSRDQLRTETARLTFQGANVTLENALEQTIVPTFSTPGTGVVNPAAGTDPGLAAIFLDIIPASLTTQVLAQLPGKDGVVLAKIRVFGTTLGGQDIESGPFVFPIHVCQGCLVSYPASALSFDVANVPTCSLPATGTTTSTETICIPGQDQPVLCSSCSGGNAVCLKPCANCSVMASQTNRDNLCPGIAVPTACQ